MKKIKIYEPDISFKEIYCVTKTMLSRWVGYGEQVNVFKNKICEKLKLNNEKSIIYGSATNAIFILFKVLKINGEIIVPSVAYAGIANAIVESGARLNICDVDDDINPSLFNIKNVYNKNCRAVVINNYGGIQPVELYKIKNFCKEKNMLLIEDRACNLIGGKNNHLADFVIYSFNNSKVLTTVEGGMLYINNNKYLKYKEELELHNFLGIKKDLLTNKFNYEQDNNIYLPGNKSILSSINASIGIAQIDKLDNMINKRLDNEQIYYRELEHDFHVPKISQYPKNWYWIRTSKEKKEKIIQAMKENNIDVNFKYYPLHLTNLYKKENKKLIKSEEINSQVICLPIHSCLEKNDVKKICKILKKVKITK